MSKEQTELLKLAKLANIHIDPDDVEKYQQDINRILELFEQLQQLDTSQVDNHSNPHLDNHGHQEIPLRPDRVNEACPRQELQHGAVTEDGLYIVPRVIE